MDQIEIYISLLAMTVAISLIFKKSFVPIPLLLVIVGMLFSLLPELPSVELNPNLVLNVFLPLLVYTASTEFSWKEVKNNLRPILLLSIGHVLFITMLVGVLVHYLVPSLGWAKAFILGAIVSPPDDVAILAIAEKIRLPARVVTILTGESILNDATALTLFRFALVADITHQFSAESAVSMFFIVIIGETLYGLALGHLIGKLRLRIEDSALQMIISIITPFLAYFPASKLGGSGILAVVVTGFVIGNYYLDRISPEARLTARASWKSISFSLQSLLFLLVGFGFKHTLEGISSIPIIFLLQCSLMLVLVVILGRFIWVYLGSFLPRWLFPSILKKDPHPPWQLLFIISWSGMRGAISLAAALALPIIPSTLSGTNSRDFIIFLVFSVIIATLLIQGMTLPFLLKIIGVDKFGKREKFSEHLSELAARKQITMAVLQWLELYKKKIKDNQSLLDKVEFKLLEYKMLKEHLVENIHHHQNKNKYTKPMGTKNIKTLALQIAELERETLFKIWQEDKISHKVMTKLLQQLDHRIKHFT